MEYKIDTIGPYKEKSMALLEAFRKTVDECEHTQKTVAERADLLQSTVCHLLNWKTYKYDFSRQTMLHVKRYVESHKEDPEPIQTIDPTPSEPTLTTFADLEQVLHELVYQGFKFSLTISSKD